MKYFHYIQSLNFRLLFTLFTQILDYFICFISFRLHVIDLVHFDFSVYLIFLSSGIRYNFYIIPTPQY